MTQEEAVIETQKRGWWGVVPMVWKDKCELNYADMPLIGKMKVRTLGRGNSWEEAFEDAQERAMEGK